MSFGSYCKDDNDIKNDLVLCKSMYLFVCTVSKKRLLETSSAYQVSKFRVQLPLLLKKAGAVLFEGFEIL